MSEKDEMFLREIVALATEAMGETADKASLLVDGRWWGSGPLKVRGCKDCVLNRGGECAGAQQAAPGSADMSVVEHAEVQGLRPGWCPLPLTIDVFGRDG